MKKYLRELTNNQKLFCVALSSDNSHSRIENLKILDIEFNDLQLYKESVIDEVDSHIAWLLQEAKFQMADFWGKSLEDVKKRIDNLMEELETVASTFDKYGIQIVALKNAGITKGIYKNNACSPMGDIDLLVASKDFHAAHELLISELGYKFKFRSLLEEEDLEEAFKGGGTEYFKESKGYLIWLELQWRPVAGRWIQPHNEPNGDELLSRSIEIPGSKVRLLAPEDNLLQVCLHTAKHSYCRAPGFRLHSDVDRIVRYTNIDWEKFIISVENLKLKTAVFFSLYFASMLLETPIPGYALNRLKPSRIKSKLILNLIQKAGIFDQRKRKFSKSGYILLNLILYDNLSEILKAIFPNKTILKSRYNFNSNFLLPYFHLIRLKDLIIKRAKL